MPKQLLLQGKKSGTAPAELEVQSCTPFDFGDNSMSKLAHAFVLTGLVAMPALATAADASPHSVTGNLGFFSDYAFRGVSQTDEDPRSEEHTSELQSPKDLVCRLLLEKK